MRSPWIIAAVMIIVLVALPGTGAVGLNAPEIVFSGPGEERASNITLDQAPGSISGYDITISLEPAGIANITRVEYPGWAVLSQTSPLPAETVRIRAANMQSSAIPSEGSVELARIYVMASGAGTVTPEIIYAEVDSYSGEVEVSITPTGAVPTVTVSESGLGSISYTGPEVSGGSAIPSSATPTGTSSATPAGMTPGPAGEGSGGSQYPATPPVTAAQTAGNVIEAAPSTPTPLPTTVPGPGPVTLVIAGLLAALLCAGKIKK